MAQHELECGSFRLTRADNSGYKCVSIPTKRELTSGEISMAKTIFQDAIDYSKVYIHDEEYLLFGLQDDNTVMTPNGEIYFPKGHYKADYSQESNSYKHLFIHEMVHVWQSQLGYPVAIKGLLLHPYCKMEGCDPYHYSLSSDKKLCDYNMEQQGDIIADYFAYYHLNSAIPVSVSGLNSVNHIHDYLLVLSDFLSDPSNTNNLSK